MKINEIFFIQAERGQAYGDTGPRWR